MKSYSELFVPTSWNKTSTENPANPIRSAWPEVKEIDEDIFNLSILVKKDIKEDLTDGGGSLLLTFTHNNNEIMLFEETEHLSKQNTNNDGNVSEFKYLLKVFDHDTNSIMYYETKLMRVEIAKCDDERDNLSEHLEVIAVLDDENPFDTDFEIPEDYKKKK